MKLLWHYLKQYKKILFGALVLAFPEFFAMLAAVVFLTVMVQIGKARDAQRKADLDKIRKALEDWFDDYGRFPQTGDFPDCGQGFGRYLAIFPCDPRTRQPYTYVTDASGSWFKLYTSLERVQDPVITKIGCQSGCGPGGAYNYGVSSSNVGVGDGEEEGVEPECGGPGKWFCFANICSECCPGSSYRCNGRGTRCILDATCGN